MTNLYYPSHVSKIQGQIADAMAKWESDDVQAVQQPIVLPPIEQLNEIYLDYQIKMTLISLLYHSPILGSSRQMLDLVVALRYVLDEHVSERSALYDLESEYFVFQRLGDLLKLLVPRVQPRAVAVELLRGITQNHPLWSSRETYNFYEMDRTEVILNIPAKGDLQAYLIAANNDKILKEHFYPTLIHGLAGRKITPDKVSDVVLHAMNILAASGKADKLSHRQWLDKMSTVVATLTTLRHLSEVMNSIPQTHPLWDGVFDIYDNFLDFEGLADLDNELCEDFDWEKEEEQALLSDRAAQRFTRRDKRGNFAII